MVSSSGKVGDTMMITFLCLFMVLGAKITSTNSFSTGNRTPCRKNAMGVNVFRLGSSMEDYNSNDATKVMPARRDFFQQSSILAAATLLSNAAPTLAQESTETIEGFQVVKTQSGLKYIELQQGTSSKTPQYGQLCVISYTGYLQLPKDNKMQKFASQSGFVLKHGNGKLIAGLDEGLHTMKRGGRRRIIIPPKLGFVQSGLGPLPELPWERSALNNLLTKMVEQRGGNLIYDVQLERFFDDEADQGYYGDDEISPEEFAELNRRLNRNNPTLDVVGDDIEITERDRERPIV